MNRLIGAVERIGDVADTVAATTRRAPSRVRDAWAVPRHRWVGVAAGAAMLLLYLLAIGDLTLSSGRGGGTVELAADWTARLIATRAPWLFEPVAAVRPASWLTVFVSPGNLLLGGLLAALLALNVAVSAYQVFTVRACRRTAFGRLLGVLPAFGVGFACCAPTLLLAVGTGFAAALMPVFLPLRSWLFPASLLLMLAALLWSTARTGVPPGGSERDLGAGVNRRPGEPVRLQERTRDQPPTGERAV